ncbi:MAG: 30S ribosomal protein S17 [Proteobacteria bacterium]|nr:30S ribosomal protein S17 [Pseudomonadota bacterium]
MKERGIRKTLIGTVCSDKMDKTVVVRIERLVKHPRYEKFLRKGAKYKAHDEMNECHIGDTVSIIETRPLSREKRWRVKEIIKRAM